MKNYILFTATLITLLFGFQSCNDKVELAVDFQETPIIYGLLDQSDSVHMIKITRAFIGPGNSLDIAQIPDSSYFNSVYAEIREYTSTGLSRTWVLKDSTILNKETNGIFYAPEQKVYVMYSKSLDNSDLASGNDLSTDATYRLYVNINNGEFEVEGETDLVKGIDPSSDVYSYTYDFVKNDGSALSSENLNTATGNSNVMQMSLVLHYSEYIGMSATQKSKEWVLGEYYTDQNSTQAFSGPGAAFFNQIQIACENADPLVDKRNFEGITLKVVAGSEDFYNYMLVNEPSSSLAQNKPSYTNLEASDGRQVIGIFASRFTFTYYHPYVSPFSQSVSCLGTRTRERLCTGPETGSLLFCSQHPKDVLQGETWACN